MTFNKAGKTLTIKKDGLSGTGRIMTKCTCEYCKGKSAPDLYHKLPCGCHHTLINQCTCKLRDYHCRNCGRVFVAAGQDWYEVEDPHVHN